MRVTNNMMAKKMLYNLNQGMERLGRLNDKLSSGKEVTLPSHDPAAVARIMRLRTTLMETEQYRNNVDDMLSWLEATDSVLGSVGEALHRVRELVIYGANDNLPDESRLALADEVDQILRGLVFTANSTHGVRHLFAGHKTTEAPFEMDVVDGEVVGVQYMGDDGKLEVEIGVGIVMDYNLPGDQVFSDIFTTLIQVRDWLRAGDCEELSTTGLAEVTKCTDDLLRWRSEIGAKVNRLEMTRERMTDFRLNVQKLLSQTEDIDLAQVVMELKMEENAYRTALASGARIIQPSLLDFLR
ncbi:MAG: flagellar hook-associated protein FlgL [Limnochordia bacterium]